VCALRTPACEFYFELLDERFNPDGLDERLFRLSELPLGSIAQFEDAARSLGSADEAGRCQARQHVDALRSQKRETALVLLSRDLESFQGCWLVEGGKSQLSDLFDFLRVAQKKPSPAA